MSRFRKFAHSLVSGYALVGVNVLFTLASVPLALSYLNKEEFGLWALAMQVANYISLVEFGMPGSIARILIDHKDHPADGKYGAVIKTGALVLLVQGVIIALAGAALSSWLAGLFNLPATLLRSFQWLVAGQCALLALSFAGRIFVFVLHAHQRYDAHNYSLMGSFAVNLLVLWIGFKLNLGVYSMLAASGTATVFSAVYCVAAAWGLLPPRGCWGRANWTTFRELLSYGTDIFLLSVGQMLINTSQVLVISRTLGLEVTAVWSIATKVFALAQQMVYRILDFSIAPLSEMMVRRERERLRTRFRDLVVLTASASVVAGLAVALCNQNFLEIWTRGRIRWGVENDLLMALSLIVYSHTRCHICLAGLTKQIRAMKFIYFAEGGGFMLLGLLTASRLGLPGVILSGVLTNIAFSGIYGIRRTTEYFEIRAGEVLFGWLQRPTVLFLIMLGAVTALWFATRALPASAALAVNGTISGCIGCYCGWRFGLPQHTRAESAELLSRWRARFLGGREV